MNFNLFGPLNQDENILTGGALELISIESTSTSFIKKWRCQQKRYKIRFPRECNSFEEANRLVKKIFDGLYKYIFDNTKPKDKVRVVFSHPSLLNNVSCPFIDIENFSAKLMIDMLQRVSQSNRELKVDSDLLCMVQIVDMPVGSGSRMDQYIIKNNSIKIANNDNLCAVRAILIAIAYLEKDPCRYKYCKLYNKKFEEKVQALAKACKIPDKPCSIKEIQIIESYLKDYSISVLNEDFQDFLYKSNPRDKFIYLWYINNHYNAITSMAGAYKRKFYCDYCKFPYHTKQGHYCQNKCKSCNRQKCIDFKEIECSKCKKFCRNSQCTR